MKKNSSNSMPIAAVKRSAGIVCLIISLTVFSISDLFAGRGDKAGTAGAPELLIPIGARGLSLGGAPLSTIDGLEAIFWNPAGLARAPYQTGVMFSHMNYIADVGVDYAGVCTDLSELGKVALSVKTISFGDIPITTEDEPDGTGEFAHPMYFVFGGTISRLITDHIGFGITTNYIIENIEKVSATDFAFTFGIQYRGLGGIDNLGVGVVIRNLGPQIKYSGDGLTRNAQIEDNLRPGSPVSIEAASNDLPSTIEIGLGYSLILSDLSVMNISSSFQNNNYSDDAYRFGAEVVYNRFLSLRGGYIYNASDTNIMSIFGLSAGFGIQTTIEGASVSIDYSYNAVKLFDGNHIVALSIGL